MRFILESCLLKDLDIGDTFILERGNEEEFVLIRKGLITYLYPNVMGQDGEFKMKWNTEVIVI